METARPNNHKIAIIGSGTLALAVARALRAEGLGVAVLPDLCSAAPNFLGVVEATGGMAPAFDCAMTALGKGLPLITASPLLAGVHGQVLATAARAQNVGLGLSGALLGALPLPTLGDEIIMLSDGAAAYALERLESRGQNLETSARELTARHADVSDLGGKTTLCRALALHGLWSGHKWLNPAAAQRVDVASLSPDRAGEVRRAGYVLRFGALIQPQKVYVGPLALGANEALAQRPLNQGLILQSGPLTLEMAQPEAERALAGMLHDVRLLCANQLAAPMQTAPRTEARGPVTDWLPLGETALIPVVGEAAQTALRIAA